MGDAKQLISKIATDQEFRERLNSLGQADAKKLLDESGFGDVTAAGVRDASFEAARELTDESLFTMVASNAADDTITTTTTTTTVFASAAAAVAAAI